jgi:hypothetical protein
MLYDDGENFVSIICSEKQGSDAGLEELYRLGLIRNTVPPLNFTVNTGMVSRVFYDDRGKIIGHEVVDKFGQPIKIPHGEFPLQKQISTPTGIEKMDLGSNLSMFFKERLPRWEFSEFRKALGYVTKNSTARRSLEELTKIHGCLAGWNIGNKDRGTLIHIVREHINEILCNCG